MPKFTSVEYKNIQSVGNTPITIQLDRSPNTLIGGANGAGKSTLGYAITYALFGKFPSGIKLAQAINSINKKNLLVKLNFVERGDEYTVIRGEKPKKFEIWKNGEMLDQEANARDQQKTLETIIGFDYQLFTQIVMLNKERYVPFMEMSSTERRKIIEDILDIRVFTVMNDVCKARIKENEREVRTIEHKQELAQSELSGILKLADQVSEQIEALSEKKDDEANEAYRKMSEKMAVCQAIEAEIAEIDLAGHETVMKQINEYSEIGRDFETNKKSYQKEINFLSENDVCPTCEQDIDSHTKECRINTASDAIKNINETVAEMMTELEKVVARNDEYKALQTKKTQLQNELRAEQREYDFYERQYKKLSEATPVDTALQTKLQQHIDAYESKEAEIEQIREEHEGILKQQQLLNVMKQVLKDDGIKAMVVNEYIDLFNVKVNEYINSMNFYVNVVFDAEFNLEFHSMGRESFSVGNLSTGQKTRLNLAVLLSFLEIASIKNSVVSNLLFVDEMLENLDAEGAKDFMTLCREKLSDKNVFVITQRYDEFLDLFRSSIRFGLNNDFTEIMRD